MPYLTTEKQLDILNMGYDINVWISDRSGRKSSVTQETLLEEALNGRPFILLRNKKDELITEHWLSEYVLKKYKGYTFFTEKINSNITSIKVRTPDEEVYIYCYGLYVSLAQKYKSSYYEGFESVKYIVWEECIPNTPLLQNIRHIRMRCMTEIYNVLSIASTVARDNKVQLIWLGNDIKENILNPVTIGFNLLERLEANMEIQDTVFFNYKEYSYYFNYFDFDGAVNHWLFNESLQICNRLDNTEELVRYDLIIKSVYKKYYVYNAGGFIHISDVDYNNAASESGGIFDEADLFKKYNAMSVYVQYPLHIALEILCTFYGVRRDIISLYYGADWRKGIIKFTPDNVEDNTVILNIENINKMSLSQIMQSPQYRDIQGLNQLLKNFSVTYSNIKIQLLCEELKTTLLFT